MAVKCEKSDKVGIVTKQLQNKFKLWSWVAFWQLGLWKEPPKLPKCKLLFLPKKALQDFTNFIHFDVQYIHWTTTCNKARIGKGVNWSQLRMYLGAAKHYEARLNAYDGQQQQGVSYL